MNLPGARPEHRPVASFVCITYNHVDMVHRCLDAFLAQDVDFDVEMIVLDDASTDGTRRVLEDYARDHPGRFTLVLPEVNSARRQGNSLCDALDAARGDFVLMCEGDDFWTDPHKARKQVTFLREHRDYAYAFHGAVRTDTGGRTVGRMIPDEWARDWTPEEVRSAGFLYFPIGTLCFRRPREPWPMEFRVTPNGDIFLARLLAELGAGHFMGDEITPLHSTVHSGGMWSGATDEEKSRMLARTYLNLTSWLLRRGHTDDAWVFARGTLIPFLQQVDRGPSSRWSGLIRQVRRLRHGTRQ